MLFYWHSDPITDENESCGLISRVKSPRICLPLTFPFAQTLFLPMRRWDLNPIRALKVIGEKRKEIIRNNSFPWFVEHFLNAAWNDGWLWKISGKSFCRYDLNPTGQKAESITFFRVLKQFFFCQITFSLRKNNVLELNFLAHFRETGFNLLYFLLRYPFHTLTHFQDVHFVRPNFPDVPFSRFPSFLLSFYCKTLRM